MSRKDLNDDCTRLQTLGSNLTTLSARTGLPPFKLCSSGQRRDSAGCSVPWGPRVGLIGGVPLTRQGPNLDYPLVRGG